MIVCPPYRDPEKEKKVTNEAWKLNIGCHDDHKIIIQLKIYSFFCMSARCFLNALSCFLAEINTINVCILIK